MDVVLREEALGQTRQVQPLERHVLHDAVSEIESVDIDAGDR